MDDLSTDGPYSHCAPAINLARVWVTRTCRGEPPAKAPFFYGPTGTGKTTVAAAMAVETDAAFWGMRQFITRCKEEMRCQFRDSVVDRAIRTPLLVLDDVGKQRATPYVVEVTQDVLEQRFDRGLLTCLTSNLTPTEMREYLGDPCWSRLRAASFDVAMVSADLRGVA